LTKATEGPSENLVEWEQACSQVGMEGVGMFYGVLATKKCRGLWGGGLWFERTRARRVMCEPSMYGTCVGKARRGVHKAKMEYHWYLALIPWLETPVLVRSRKLSSIGSSQYYRGGPDGNPTWCKVNFFASE
jgi:hypothetical protein